MIRSVIITNNRDESLTLDFFHPEKTGIAVESIDGIGYPTANINTTEMATTDGAIYNSSRSQSRNVQFHLLMYDYDAEYARHLTYKYFPVKGQIKMDFIGDERQLYCTGYVESNEAEVFSNQVSVDISVICPDPFFYDDSETMERFYGVVPTFYFSFSNESLTDNKIVFGTFVADTRSTIIYKGDVETGVHINIHAKSNITNITIFNVSTDDRMRINTAQIKQMTGVQFGAGDDIDISTYKGRKSITLLHLGEVYNIIGTLDRTTNWFQLIPGENEFAYRCDDGSESVVVTLTYSNAYGGM